MAHTINQKAPDKSHAQSQELLARADRDCDSVSSTPGTKRRRWERVAALASSGSDGSVRIIRLRGTGVRRLPRGIRRAIASRLPPRPASSRDAGRPTCSKTGLRTDISVDAALSSAGCGQVLPTSASFLAGCKRWSTSKL